MSLALNNQALKQYLSKLMLQMAIHSEMPEKNGTYRAKASSNKDVPSFTCIMTKFKPMFLIIQTKVFSAREVSYNCAYNKEETRKSVHRTRMPPPNAIQKKGLYVTVTGIP